MLGMKVLLFTLATSHQFLGMDTLVQPLEISTLHMSSLVESTAAGCGSEFCLPRQTSQM